MPLDAQAATQGVRQFELDLYYNAALKRFEVRHVGVFDAETTCFTFADCLTALRTFSDAHPQHVPLWVWLEPKEADDTMIDGNLLATVEAEIDAIWPANRRISPDDIRVDAVDLRSAVAAKGWPLLNTVRGKAIFTLLESGKVRDAYVAADPALKGRVLFAEGGKDTAWGVTAKIDDPISGAQAIGEAVLAGQLIRTRADATDEPWAGDTSRREAAFASGAQACSTDFPAEVAEPAGYSVRLPGLVVARCNPVNAPPGCPPGELE